MGFEANLRAIWDHPITACALGMAAVCAIVGFLDHSPTPGVAIAVLGVVAAVISIRTLSSYEKFFWTLVAFGLLYAEIRAIRVDRLEQSKHALEDRAAQDNQFLALNQKQDVEFVATKGLQISLDKQFQKTVPVQPFHNVGKTDATQRPTDQPLAKHPSEVQAPIPSQVQQAVLGSLTISQSEEVSTRPDAPYKARVIIQTTVEMSALKLVLKCTGPLVEAQGGPIGSGILMMTSQGISNADRSLWFLQYGNASPPFGPSNPIAVNVWSTAPVICNQAKTF
jgi:hypothetical protein